MDAHDEKALITHLQKFSPFDHVLSMLGGAMSGGFLDSSMETIRTTIEDKFFANLVLARQVIPMLNPGKSLTFTSGTGGIQPMPQELSSAIKQSIP